MAFKARKAEVPDKNVRPGGEELGAKKIVEEQ
jgi:hypothetical protein